MDLKNDHNVYILGAGFSREAGLPLISDFLVRMRDSHPWLLAQGRSSEAEAVKQVLEFRLQASSAAYWTNLDLENIEELFSLASASTSTVSSDIQLAIAATLDFAAKTSDKRDLDLRLENLPWADSASWLTPLKRTKIDQANFSVERYTHHVAKLLGMFRDGTVKGENTFITFNYDTILEEALIALKLPLSYGFKKQSLNLDRSAKATNDVDSLSRNHAVES